jgi:hypothetical protein
LKFIPNRILLMVLRPIQGLRQSDSGAHLNILDKKNEGFQYFAMCPQCADIIELGNAPNRNVLLLTCARGCPPRLIFCFDHVLAESKEAILSATTKEQAAALACERLAVQFRVPLSQTATWCPSELTICAVVKDMDHGMWVEKWTTFCYRSPPHRDAIKTLHKWRCSYPLTSMNLHKWRCSYPLTSMNFIPAIQVDVAGISTSVHDHRQWWPPAGQGKKCKALAKNARQFFMLICELCDVMIGVKDVEQIILLYITPALSPASIQHRR